MLIPSTQRHYQSSLVINKIAAALHRDRPPCPRPDYRPRSRTCGSATTFSTPISRTSSAGAHHSSNRFLKIIELLAQCLGSNRAKRAEANHGLSCSASGGRSGRTRTFKTVTKVCKIARPRSEIYLRQSRRSEDSRLTPSAKYTAKLDRKYAIASNIDTSVFRNACRRSSTPRIWPRDSGNGVTNRAKRSQSTSTSKPGAAGYSW